MQTFTKAVIFLISLGAIVWGLVGVFEWNLVEAIFGGGATEDASIVSRIIYVIIGLAGVAALFLLPRLREETPPRARTVSRAT